MNKRKIIEKILFLLERPLATKAEILDCLKLIESTHNLDVYKGYLITYYFHKFKEFPRIKHKNFTVDEKFLKCIAILNGVILPSPEIGFLFSSILSIPDSEAECRDMLLGSFYSSLWPFMNNPENFEMAVDYGIEIVKSAFSLDKFDFTKKIKSKKNAKIINLAGSGKKEIKLLNISSMTAVVTAAVGKKIGENIVVEKTISMATSSVTGSGDIFESLGVNLDMPIDKMAKISIETKLGVFDINRIVPKLNHVYDGRLYDVQVFAGLVGGAAIVNPVDADLINYGLTRGLNKLCLAILSQLYPNKNILVLQGKNTEGKSIIDQVSIAADTEIAQRINGKKSVRTITPKEFGFDFEPFRHIQTTKSLEKNIEQFIKLIAGRGNKNLEQAVAMEVALNLYGIEVINDLKIGAKLAIETINSGAGIKILENLISNSNGDMNKFNGLLKVSLN